MDHAPTVISVIVPAYDAAQFIQAALDCIEAQALDCLEIIVVDDGSKDQTAELALAHSIGAKVIRQANSGPGAARNAGVKAARGSYITFLDVDDEWATGSLARRLETLQAHPEADMVIGLVRFEGLDGREIPLTPWTAPNLGAGLYRRELFEKIGYFEPGLLLDDVDWFLRARDAGVGITKLNEITLKYRRHSESLTAAKTWLELGLGKVLRRALQRRESAAVLQEGTIP
jgi:glycosyltransferase involved in cell wall biosynthesis